MPKNDISGRIFDSVNYVLLSIFAIVTLVPFIHVIASSFASERQVINTDFLLFPTEFSLNAYRYIFSSDQVVSSLLNSMYVTTFGTAINIFLTTLMAYALSRNHLRMKKPLIIMVVFTLIFQGGLIPDYLVVKEMGMLNTYWALLIPRAIVPFFLIIMISFFRQLPEGIQESARIDGCGDIKMLIRIVLPLSLPVIATLVLFYAVMHWNTYMHAILYIRDAEKWPIQVLLRQIVLVSTWGISDESAVEAHASLPPITIRMAVITVATAPILLLYPFLQKHFVKGATLGAIKG